MTNEAANPLASQDRLPRILLMGEAIALSHVARPFLFAKYLQRRGYEVCLARDPRYKRLFSENDLKVADLNSIDGSIAETRLARHEPVHDAETLDRYVQEDIRVIREFRPEIVVGDFRHSLAISSRLMRVPYINIADGHWCPSVDTHYELPNSPLAEYVGMPFSNVLFQIFKPLAFAYQTLPLNLVRMKYGLPAVGPDVKTCNSYGDYTVYPNDPELFHFHETLPAKQHFLGPVLWSPTVELPEWWDQIPDDRPIVYVSLGSTGSAGFLNTVLRVLEDLPVTVLLATAARWETRPVSKNIFTADFLPGTEVARRSRLVICNGGTMSGQQALSAGVPYLGLISNLDQMLFSMAVRDVSGCELLREGEVNENKLRSVIQNMLTQEKYRTAVKRLAIRTAILDPYKKFEEVLCSVLEERTPGIRRKFEDFSKSRSLHA